MATTAQRGISRASRKFVVDLCTLARRDHDDLDRALLAMLEATTPPREQSGLLDIFRLALAVHLVAEMRVLGNLVSTVRPPSTLRLQIAQLRTEHMEQQLAAERLIEVEPGSDAWYAGVLELRVRTPVSRSPCRRSSSHCRERPRLAGSDPDADWPFRNPRGSCPRPDR